MMKRTTYLWTLLIAVGLGMVSCLDKEEMEAKLNDLEQRISKLEEAAGKANSNTIALHAFLKEETIVVGFKKIDNSYELELSDGTKLTITDGLKAPAVIPIIGIDADGKWIMSLDNGETFSPVEGSVPAGNENGKTPMIKVDNDGYWLVSTDGGTNYSQIIGENGKPQSAVNGMITGDLYTFFKEVRYDSATAELTLTLLVGDPIVIPVVETFYLNVKGYEEKEQIFLGQIKEYDVEMGNVKEAMFQVPDGWAAVLSDNTLQVTAPSSGTDGEYTINMIITSPEGYIKHLTYTFTFISEEFHEEYCQAYIDWVNRSENNMLLDFSYAGYEHGETAPSEAAEWVGYKVYDVTSYGAVPNDGISDRNAFLKCLEAATGQSFISGDMTLTLGHKEKANAIIYFPEGKFILHDSDDNHTVNDKSYSQTIMIRSGNIILRGAGRDLTTLVMQTPNLPDPVKTGSAQLYSSPVMLDFKHNSGLGGNADHAVVKNASKGDFSIELESATGLAVDQWVCLTMKNNDPVCVENELKDGNPTNTELQEMTNIVNEGVQVYEFHKIKDISGNIITFYEPIMKDVDINYTNYSKEKETNNKARFWNWSIKDYPHYEYVGIEDLTFEGNAKADFEHHASWEDDGAYKPLSMTRLVNSWLRRVRFRNVSEACSVIKSANVSVYDVIIYGNRGHAAIRSQESTRVFIGACIDKAGQYHAVGVSKPSMGAVLWRNEWGNDSCFESHATQPRATLIDNCKGGWVPSRQGGDSAQVPNHLESLTIWNFEATTVSGNWIWWDHNSNWHKYLPPILVGFHGAAVSFDHNQVKADISNGTAVYPESLYEAQLKERLGAVPAWLNSLK